MIEVRELGRRGTLADVEATLAQQLRLGARQLALAAHWADLHHPDGLSAPDDPWEVRRRRPDGDHGVQPGGSGTPEILASCPAELGLVLQTSAGGAKHLIADALVCVIGCRRCGRRSSTDGCERGRPGGWRRPPGTCRTR